MRKLIVKNFVLYERVQANAFIFCGTLLMLVAIVNFILAGLTTPTIIVALGVAGALLFLWGEIFAYKKLYSTLRCGKFIFLTFVLLGVNVIVSGQYFNWITWLLLFIILLEVWITFTVFGGWSYFKLWPLKWEELDDEQKFDYGRNNTTLTPLQQKEWTDISQTF